MSKLIPATFQFLLENDLPQPTPPQPFAFEAGSYSVA